MCCLSKKCFTCCGGSSDIEIEESTNIDNSCCCSCCRFIKCKRWFLILIGVISLFAMNDVRDYPYIPMITSFCAFIIFWNFPCLVYYTASKPLYYQDIFIDEKKLPNYDVDISIKKKFKCILIWVLIILNTILVGALSEYWFYKLHGNLNHDWIEVMGITGGIIKIFQIISNAIVRAMLKILKYYVKKESSQFTKDQIKAIEKILHLKRKDSEDGIVIVDEKIYEKRSVGTMIELPPFSNEYKE